MVKIYKLTRKENPSEIINSIRTKKYSSLHSTHNTNYKKNIKELIQTENKRKQKHKYRDSIHAMHCLYKTCIRCIWVFLC